MCFSPMTQGGAGACPGLWEAASLGLKEPSKNKLNILACFFGPWRRCLVTDHCGYAPSSRLARAQNSCAISVQLIFASEASPQTRRDEVVRQADDLLSISHDRAYCRGPCAKGLWKIDRRLAQPPLQHNPQSVRRTTLTRQSLRPGEMSGLSKNLTHLQRLLVFKDSRLLTGLFGWCGRRRCCRGSR
jgi:hypothetical protein